MEGSSQRGKSQLPGTYLAASLKSESAAGLAVNANVLAGATEGTGLGDLTKESQQGGKEKEDGDLHFDGVFWKLVRFNGSRRIILRGP